MTAAAAAAWVKIHQFLIVISSVAAGHVLLLAAVVVTEFGHVLTGAHAKERAKTRWANVDNSVGVADLLEVVLEQLTALLDGT